MISRNKGIFSLEFLVPLFAFAFSVTVVYCAYHYYVTPRAENFLIKRRIINWTSIHSKTLVQTDEMRRCVAAGVVARRTQCSIDHRGH